MLQAAMYQVSQSSCALTHWTHVFGMLMLLVTLALLISLLLAFALFSDLVALAFFVSLASAIETMTNV